MRSDKPRRRVVHRECLRTESQPEDLVMIMLDCGHRKIYERSKEPRTDHVRCAECLNPMATDYTENPE